MNVDLSSLDVMSPEHYERSGYPHREWGLQISNAQNGSPRCCLAWMDANELLVDLRGFLAGFTTQVYLRVDNRRAQNQR